jgi:phage head maturation protease
MTGPASYDPDRRTVDCVITTGACHRRSFGYEVTFAIERRAAPITKLATSKDSVDLTKLKRGGIPLLVNHDVANVVGKVIDVWVKGRKVYATLRFARTDAGREAEAKVSRGELPAVSVGFMAQEWRGEDAETGDEVEIGEFRDWSYWGGAGSTVFVAQRWQLVEVSLTTIPRDSAALIL